MTTLTCPKCHGEMRSYERNGVTVDQCGECRGIFLDRGELEHLVTAEARFNAPTPAPPQQQQQQYRDDPRGYAPQQPYHKPHKKKKSFFEELFD
jgi:Zn-finger nucleic acid-binding protein